jgi:formylglycine-generating enzyme
MVKLIVILSLLLCNQSARADGPLKIALVPVGSTWSSSGNLPTYARSLLEKELSQSDRFILVERQRIQQVLEETSFQQSGVTEGKGTAELGRLLDVDRLFFLQTHRLPSGYELTLKIVDVATGRVLRVEKQSLGREQRQTQLAIRRLGRRLGAVASLLSPTAMVLLPTGSFPMGSEQGLPDERPVHPISIESFYLDRYEVSRVAYRDFLITHGKPGQIDLKNPEHPATEVSWSDAVTYCRDQGKRLPTEAEWEYAARGTDGRTYPWGEAVPTPDLARFQTRQPLPVGSLPAGATPEGIHHMAGNAAEWVQDWWDPGYYDISPSAGPPGPSAGDFRAVRGGSWNQPADELRATSRTYHNPDRGAGHIGFRCARNASP